MVVSVLLDTNIVIYREDNEIIDNKIQRLFRLLNKNNFDIFIHENSIKDINKDKNKKRKKIILSKIKSYPLIKSPYDFREDKNFIKLVGFKDNNNDFVDNSLLYSLFKEECTFLITNDKKIHKKAKKLDKIKKNFSNRVFNIPEALNNFEEKNPIYPYNIQKTTMNYLELSDPIFNKLKDDYDEFNEWFKNKQKEKRDCLTYKNLDNTLGALLVYKKEHEEIELKDKVLPPKNRVKIATMIVTSEGYKIGEFFLKWIINYALLNGINELYLTHFIEDEEDSLIYLIEEYGFTCEGYKSNGEVVYCKNINKFKSIEHINNEIGEKSAIELAKKYYPYFYDGVNVKKFIVPIKDIYHEKLFLNDSQQSTLIKEISISKNTIKKAYLCKTNTKVNIGDVLIFYETPKKGISEMGVVESVKRNMNIEEINKSVGKRSVYSQDELKEFAGNNTIFLFLHCITFNKIPSKKLFNEKIIKGYPQTTQTIKHENYLKLKGMIENEYININ